MDPWTRNERLYRHLLGLGLIVFPITVEGDETKIDHLWVSTSLSASHSRAEQSAERPVHAAMERPQVGDGVISAESPGDGVVVKLPPKL